MRTSRTATRSDLRRAIDCLPRHTKEAMLQGIASNPIIVGAYTSSDGICPMLAAHRAGGRTSMISFARAWDRFAYRDCTSKRRHRSRRASQRELLVLRAYLEASLLSEEAPVADLAAAQREHEQLVMQRRKRSRRQRTAHSAATTPRPTSPAARPGDPYRGAELGDRPGWSWTRLFRRYDEYEQALSRLEAALPEPERAAARPADREPALS
jgi:hypothetical protein